MAQRIYWELGAIHKGGKDYSSLAVGNKALCRRAYKGLTEERKQKYELIELVPYNDEERLDYDETLYTDFAEEART